MVIRDSPADFIGVKVWGSKEYLNDLINSLEINKCGKLIWNLNLYPIII